MLQISLTLRYPPVDNGHHFVLVRTKHLLESEGYVGKLKHIEIEFKWVGGDIYRQYLAIDWWLATIVILTEGYFIKSTHACDRIAKILSNLQRESIP